MSPRVGEFSRDERGTVTAFVVALTTACLLFAGLVLDGGLALSAKTTAIGHAEAAARAGVQKLDLVTYRTDGQLRLRAQQARSAAQSYLRSVAATGTVAITDNTVRVTVTAEQPTQLLSLIGFTHITVTGHGAAHPEQGALGGSQ